MTLGPTAFPAPKRARIGETLVREGMLSPEQLHKALAEQLGEDWREFFAEFAKSGEKTSLGGETAMRYRRQVLEPGGTRPARELVQAFLGREVSMNALRGWITQSIA